VQARHCRLVGNRGLGLVLEQQAGDRQIAGVGGEISAVCPALSAASIGVLLAMSRRS